MKKITLKSILYLSIIFITYLIKAFIQFITPRDFSIIFSSEFFLLIILFVVFEFFYFIWWKYFKKIEETKFFKDVNDSIETLFTYFLFIEGLKIFSFII